MTASEKAKLVVENLGHGIYQVVLVNESGGRLIEFQGPLLDCDAFIRLRNAGYM